MKVKGCQVITPAGAVLLAMPAEKGVAAVEEALHRMPDEEHGESTHFRRFGDETFGYVWVTREALRMATIRPAEVDKATPLALPTNSRQKLN